MVSVWKCRDILDKKRLIIIGVAVLVAIVVIVGIVVGTGKKSDGVSDDMPIADRVIAHMDRGNIKANMEYFSSEPHPAGQQRNLDLGAEIMKRWKSYGFDEVFENDYEILLSMPSENSYIEYDGVIKYQPKVNDGSNVIPPYNAFAKNGNVKGELIYVNYGRVEDFSALLDLQVELTGKIAICRYGKIFRGSKAQNAYDKGMLGMILYSDPLDVEKGKVYPEGKWLPETGVQRGNVKSVKGDLSTHLYPSYKGGYHAKGKEREDISPKIPVMPIPYEKAKPLLDMLKTTSPTTPDGWGNYNIGPSSTIVTLNVENINRYDITCRNIIGVINGKEEPDRWVLIGVHRDAWIRGASDPGSGMSTIMELSRSLGEELKKGWRPRRTIIFASWDAEEPGIIGSYEFVEDHLPQLKHNAVVYLNMDTAVNNPDLLNMKSTPNMFSLLYEAANMTKSPDPNYKNLYDFWIAAEKTHNDMDYEKPPVSLIGSGSDYTAFLNEVGISCVDFAYKTNYGTYPVYHTQYDTFQWMTKFGDSDFVYHQRIGEFAARVLISLADEKLIKMSITDYADKVNELTTSLIEENVDTAINLDLNFNGMNLLAKKFVKTAKEFSAAISKIGNDTLDEELRQLNDKLMYTDRQFVYTHGLPRRPSFRHLIFAPSSTNTYAGSAFPGVGDEIAIKDRDSIQQQIGLVTSKLEAVIRSFTPEDEEFP